MKHVMWLMILLIPVLSFAQNDGQLKINDEGVNKNEIKPLKIGDKVPDIEFKNIINYKSKTAKLSDFRGKLVLLDMWASFCSACILAFPKLEKIQKEFDGKIQIFLCNPHPGESNSEEKIIELLKKNEVRTSFYPTLPIPIRDTVLNTYFPHYSLPHIVWIDPSGVVVAITGSKEVTSENIRSIINNQKVKLTEKKDFLFDKSSPLFINGNGGNEKYTFRSILTPYIEGVGTYGGKRTNEDNKIIGAYEINASMRELVNCAYSSELEKFLPNRVIYEVRDSLKFLMKVSNENRMCYDIIVPPIDSESFSFAKHLKNDLKSYFNLSFRVEKRKLEFYRLNFYEYNGITTNQKAPEIDLEFTATNKYIHFVTIKTFLELLENILGTPIECSSYYTNRQRISIDFPRDIRLSDKEQVLHFLASKNIKIEKESKEFDVAIITDKSF